MIPCMALAALHGFLFGLVSFLFFFLPRDIYLLESYHMIAMIHSGLLVLLSRRFAFPTARARASLALPSSSMFSRHTQLVCNDSLIRCRLLRVTQAWMPMYIWI